jgi:hypothetical protein
MKIDLENLKELTVKAKEEGDRLNQEKRAEDSNKELQRHETAKRWAEMVATTIPSLCKKAAMEGKSKAYIINTKNDYSATDAKFPYNEFHGWNTKGSGLKYYYLEGLINFASLPYEIKYNYDGGGMDSCFEIWITWD